MLLRTEPVGNNISQPATLSGPSHPCPCSLALIGFMIMHMRLIAANMTTIEAYEKRPVK